MQSSTLRTGTVLQICFITARLEASAAWFASLMGVEQPAFGASSSPEAAKVEYLGAPSRATCRQCHFRFDNIAIEFIEPNEEPSTWRDFLDRRGPGVHHIAFGTKTMGETSRRLSEAGYPVVQKGEFDGGRYAYFDTEPGLGALIELLEFDRDLTPA